MEFNVEIKKLNELMAAFEKTPKEIKTELLLALHESLVAVQERAKKIHRFKSSTGNLDHSILPEVTSEWPPVGRVWLNPAVTKVKTSKGDASYGVFQHEGTTAHWVAPVRWKALRWVGPNGKYWFSKGHTVGGIKPDPFIYKALEFETENINAIFSRHTDEAIRKAFVALARGV